MPHITVWGNGYVGGAYADYLEDNNYNVTRVDPAQGMHPTALAFKQPSIICVPAPTLGNGTMDYSIINTIVSKVSRPIMIKSTILPDYAKALDPHVSYSPEFLKANTALEDIRSQKDMVIGGDNTVYWAGVFKSLGKEIHTTSARSASFMKYTVNSFLATKVAFMNELCDQYGGDWDELKSLLKLDPRLGASHLDVPGPTGDYGYGGECFPKDVKAFLAYTKAREFNTQMSILEQASVSNEENLTEQRRKKCRTMYS
jgi:UDPglucose 6-dehydrogenase